LRQIIFSWLYFLAKAINDGSMIPPRKRNTKCKVDSALVSIPYQYSWKLATKAFLDLWNQWGLKNYVQLFPQCMSTL
jgi:hypothetical protein